MAVECADELLAIVVAELVMSGLFFSGFHYRGDGLVLAPCNSVLACLEEGAALAVISCKEQEEAFVLVVEYLRICHDAFIHIFE